MKKTISFFLVLAMVALFTACSEKPADQGKDPDKGTIRKPGQSGFKSF